MNRFFTISLKSKRFLFLCFIILTSISVKAEEYKSMIRYDRVWECISDGDDDPDLVVKCMKFFETEVINGKEYHGIMTFRKTFPKYDYNTNTYSYDNYIDGLNQHEGYLRMEDGVAYTLIVCEKDNLPVYNGIDDFHLYGPLYIPGKYEPGEDEVLIEIPVYDFTYGQGQSYVGMSFRMENSHFSRFTVNHIENIEIEGENHRKISLLPGDSKENKYWAGEEIVEGVGAIEFGCLNYHELVSRPAMRWCQNYFNRLLDLKGNVIYGPNPIYEIQYDGFLSPNDVTVTDQLETIAAPIYDILGRRIVNPVPGQLYIQGGKKYIGDK